MRTSFSRWLTGPVIIDVLVVVVALYAGGKYNGFITQVDSGDLAAAPPAEAVLWGGGSGICSCNRSLTIFRTNGTYFLVVGYGNELLDIRDAREFVMDLNDIESGMRVRTTELGDTTGMLIASKHLNVRREGVTGTVRSWVPGHGGDVWFIAHDGSKEVGAYMFNEFEPAPRKLSEVIADMENDAAQREHQAKQGGPMSTMAKDAGEGMVAAALRNVITQLKQVDSL